jgi:hypothetical protein
MQWADDPPVRRAPKSRRRCPLCRVGVHVGPEHWRGWTGEKPFKNFQRERGEGRGAVRRTSTTQGAVALAVETVHTVAARTVATGAVAAADVAAHPVVPTVEAAALSKPVPAVECSEAATAVVVLLQAAKVRGHEARHFPHLFCLCSSFFSGSSFRRNRSGRAVLITCLE